MSAPLDSDLEDLASTSVSFSVVRHPFERLVSAYQDKVFRKNKYFTISLSLSLSLSLTDSKQSRGSSESVEGSLQDDRVPIRRQNISILCQMARWLEGVFVLTIPRRFYNFPIPRGFTRTCVQTLMKIRR